MEIKEQVSVSLRDEYDYMNVSLLIKEEYDNLLAQKGDDKKDQVIKILASRIEGRETKAIIEYLQFLEFVDLVLEQLQLEGQHHKINTKTDEKNIPVTTIVKEWQGKWAKAKNSERKILCIFNCAGYCQGVFKRARNPGSSSSYEFTARNHRNFKKIENSKKASGVLSDMTYWQKHDFTSDDDVDSFGDKIQLAQEYLKYELWLEKPSKVLQSVEASLQIINESLSSTKRKEVKSRLVTAKVNRYLVVFRKHISSIESKLKL